MTDVSANSNLKNVSTVELICRPWEVVSSLFLMYMALMQSHTTSRNLFSAISLVFSRP